MEFRANWLGEWPKADDGKYFIGPGEKFCRAKINGRLCGVETGFSCSELIDLTKDEDDDDDKKRDAIKLEQLPRASSKHPSPGKYTSWGEETHHDILVATFAVMKPTGAQWQLITEQLNGMGYGFSANALKYARNP
ncbi:Uu.00g032090.m01.CDS01 [Anthostomella pinea]|uniref:Uu.00g032090.m01.CDS01 n=1 Tax=Anthostomella pinea TaxID=933095 RepID=A0AAI8YD21_9PEZI|nr:Uu.00g032090.m01.CDS01 [Anthostomella pinea]